MVFLFLILRLMCCAHVNAEKVSLDSQPVDLSLGQKSSIEPAKTSSPRWILEEVLASVGSDPIYLSDVRKFRETKKFRSQMDPLFAETTLSDQESSLEQIVEFLIQETIISQQFSKEDVEVEQEIQTIQSKNHLSRTELKKALTEAGMDFSDYFELTRRSSSKRDLIDREIRTKVSITEDDLKNYFYNDYSKNKSLPRSFHLQIISVSATSFQAPTPQAAQHLAHQSAVKALSYLRSGETFAEVARRISDDPSSGTGGDLGLLTEDQISPFIRDHIKNMKIGDISDILYDSSSKRYFILRLVDLQTVETAHFESLKSKIEQQLAAREFQYQLNLWLERQKQNLFIHYSSSIHQDHKKTPQSP